MFILPTYSMQQTLIGLGPPTVTERRPTRYAERP